jgi:hypothetical protein
MVVDRAIKPQPPLTSIKYWKSTDEDRYDVSWIELEPLTEHMKIVLFLTNVRWCDMAWTRIHKPERVNYGPKSAISSLSRMVMGNDILDADVHWQWDSSVLKEHNRMRIIGFDDCPLIPWELYRLWCQENQAVTLLKASNIVDILEEELEDNA